MVARVTEGLKEEVAEKATSKDPLKRVMGHIRDVKKAMDSTSGMFGPLRDTVALLRSYGVHVEQVGRWCCPCSVVHGVMSA